MFKNVEEKIKKFVSIFTYLIIGLLVFAAIMVIASGSDAGIPVALILGLLCLFIWIGAIFLYAFAEMLEQSKLQNHLLNEIKEQLIKSNTKTEEIQ